MSEETATPEETPKDEGAVAEGDPALKKSDRDKLERMADAFEKIDRMLLRLGLQGLQRMTQSSATELKALEQTAHNAGLINVERQIDTLGTLVQRYIDRDPLFTMHEYTAVVNRIWLLNNMARKLHAQGKSPDEMSDVIGEARRSYEELKEPVVLQPLGATGWVTDTDFVGVTIYFYVDGRSDTIWQASNCKPCMYFGRDPRRLLHEHISEHVQYSIYSMAHGAFEFQRVKLSSDGRLSLHKELKVAPAPYQGARAYASLAVRNWIELVDRLRAGEVHPVQGSGSKLVFVEPAALGEVTIDDKNARATVEMMDEKASIMVMEVPLRAENNFLIDNLETMLNTKRTVRGVQKVTPSGGHEAATTGGRNPLTPSAMFGRAWIAEGRLKFFPITTVWNQAVISNERGKKRVNELHLGIESVRNITITEEK